MYRHSFNFNSLSYEQKWSWVQPFLESVGKDYSEESIDKVIELIEEIDDYHYWDE